jgi:release factor glutamine methyltransferase
MRVAAALALARALGVDRLDAQLLLAHRLGRPRSWLIAHDDADLDAGLADAFRADLARRAAGVPLAYLVGAREFRGLHLRVGPSVLVPRPETEHLVDWALEQMAPWPQPRVLDLGTGSGAIAVAIAHARPDARVMATDIDAQALSVARSNAQAHGVSIDWRQGSWWDAVPDGRFAVVVSNPPYVAGDDPHLAALAYEPLHALTPGGDGLDALRAIVAGAAPHLEPGGALLLEHGHDQADAVRRLLHDAGLVGVCSRRDLAGHERCSGGRQPRI